MNKYGIEIKVDDPKFARQAEIFERMIEKKIDLWLSEMASYGSGIFKPVWKGPEEDKQL